MKFESYTSLKRAIVDALSDLTEFAPREAEIILRETTGLDRAALLFSEDPPSQETAGAVMEILAKRRARMPLQYALGKAYFRNLALRVTPAVLIPRPETELMVDWALAEIDRLHRERRRTIQVLDVGTGSGAIAAAIADESGVPVAIDAVDISADAISVAAFNLSAFPNVRVYQSDLFDSVEGPYDVICSNPPYIAESERGDLLPEVLCEPELALFAQNDGYAVYERIIKRIRPHIAPGGSFIFEIGARQYDKIGKMIEDELGRKDVEPIDDYAGRRRFICLKNLR